MKARRGLLDVTVTVVVGIAVLIGLGLWQLDRRVWKEDLIARTSARFSAQPESVPPRVAWDRLDETATDFRRVEFPAEFIPGEQALVYTAGSAFRPDVSGPGYWVLSPARLAGGSVVVVNRGFVPLDRKPSPNRAQAAPSAASPSVTELIGIIRWTETRGLFTPSDQPIDNVWYVRDPRLIAQAKGWGEVAPFLVDQESPSAPGTWPRAGRLTVSLANNHLQYALTWFALALGLAGVYVTWLAARRRRH